MAAERNPATAHMFIINPLSGERADNLFSTHPDTENRIRALMAMAGKMDKAEAPPPSRPVRAGSSGIPNTGKRDPGDGKGPWDGANRRADAGKNRAERRLAHRLTSRALRRVRPHTAFSVRSSMRNPRWTG